MAQELKWDNKPKKFEVFFDQFSDYPKGIIIKIATMIWGTRFSKEALASKVVQNSNMARYFIFSYDIEETEGDSENIGSVPTYFRLKNIDNHSYGL